MATFYFNASDGGPTDPQAVWTDDANAFDGNLSTFATTSTNGSLTGQIVTSEYLQSDGTNAPTSGTPIILVKGRIYADDPGASPDWGGYTTFTTLVGASWQTISDIKARIYKATPAGANVARCQISIDNFSTILSLISRTMTDGQTSIDVYRVELEVYSDPIPGRIYRIQGFQ